MATQKFNDTDITTITTLDDTDYLNPVVASTGEIQKITVANFKTSLDIPTMPLVYAAEISQSGTNNPTVTTPVNTTGETITFARTSAGLYTATAGSAIFTANKTFVFFTPVSGGPRITMEVISTTVIQIQTFDLTTVLADSQLSGNSFKIEIYP